MTLSGWGRYPRLAARVTAPRDVAGLTAAMAAGRVIARGNGRAYGDSAIGLDNTLQMGHFNRFLAFDPGTGVLTAEAGVLLADIVKVFLPRGWFPYVTPGTKYVTLGGMIAADVHGKNHHKHGSFGSCVEWVEVLTPAGEILRCSLDSNPELFAWTVGGMGLTGVILRAAIRLRPVASAWVRTSTRVAENIAQAIEIFETTEEATYSVAWIDCLQSGAGLGRSVILVGEHAGVAEVPRAHRASPLVLPDAGRVTIPVDFPVWALNRFTVRAFNASYYRRARTGQREHVMACDRFFYPLDAILGWNRIYGRRGFVQFQCVLPLASAERGLRALLQAIAASGAGSFLAVLKRLGAQDSRFSFPMAGYTLALDFPVTSKTMALLDRLDAIAVDHGGRFYLAKDGRMSAQTFHRSDPRAAAYAEFRKSHGMADALGSAQSGRLQF